MKTNPNKPKEIKEKMILLNSMVSIFSCPCGQTFTHDWKLEAPAVTCPKCNKTKTIN